MNCETGARRGRVAIIGAGPAGLTAAYLLVRQGVDVHVLEASGEIGGLAKSISLWGQRVDLGPHRFFSADPRVNELWLEMVGQDYSMIDRQTRIFYRGRFFDYPLKPLNVLSGLGLGRTALCLLSYFKARLFPPKDLSTFDGWVTSRFGARLFETFFRAYSEKLWGIPCNELDSDFAAQRIKRFSLSEAIRSSVFRSGTARHKTLVDAFAYPDGGAGLVYERMRDRIVELGGSLHLNTRVECIDRSRREDPASAIRFCDGSVRQFDHVISTMPITHLVEAVDAPQAVRDSARRLRFRNTILVYLRLTGNNPFPDQWIYVHSQDLRMGRLTNFGNWNQRPGNPNRDTILCAELWCDREDRVWGEDDTKIIREVTRELVQARLARLENIADGKVIRVPNCYPVYRKNYRRHLAPVQQYLSNLQGITAIGRYGAFKYNNQDHSILMGILAAENILSDAGHDLWALNTDYEYQESGRLENTGL